MTVNTIRYLLEKSARLTPEKNVITHNSRSITYIELLKYVNKIAYYLKLLNLKKGTRVAIYTNKSIEQVVAICGSFID